MILVRDIFQLKFGKAREAMEILKKDMVNQDTPRGAVTDRILTDLTGQYYTLIMESTYNDLSEYEQNMQKMFHSDNWRKAYQKFAELVESGRREIFTIVPVEKTEQMRQKEEVTSQVGRGR